MKTLISLLIACGFLTINARAQFTENFEQDLTGLSSNCWVINQVNYTTTSTDVINGNGSAYTNPPTSGSGERTLATPFLDITSTSLTVSFLYKTSSKINGNSTRTLNIGISDSNGNFTSLQILTMDKNTATTVLTHNNTYTIPSTGVFRLEIRIGGATGDGNSRVIFDDLSVSATPHYGPTSHCNSPAVAVNDTYNMAGISTVNGNVLSNDQIPADNEIYTVNIVASPTEGTLVMNADGTFTYTPSATYSGGIITFTYVVVDNGYPSATSNIATVTLNFPAPVLLPVELLSFTAEANGSKVDLNWLVNNNEDGDYYLVERSEDGRTFTTIAKIAANNHSRSYSAVDAYNDKTFYYRIKIVNNDLSASYSKMVVVKGRYAEEALKLNTNPVAATLKFTYASYGANQPVSIYTIAGVKVHEQKFSSANGAGQYSVNVDQLQAGTYVLCVNSTSGRQAIKFVKR